RRRQPLGGARLVAFGVAHDHFQHGPLDGVEHHVVHGVRCGATQILEVGLQVVLDAVLDVLLAHGVQFTAQTSGANSSASSPLRMGELRGRRSWCWPSSSKKADMAFTWATLLSRVFMCWRKSSPPGRARTAQPMCLRAVRTPANSPYRP